MGPMRSLRRPHRATLLLVALYGLAMLLVPLAHRPLDMVAGPDLSAYALPDGTIAVLCSTVPAKSGQPTGRSGGTCDACLLTSAPGLIVTGVDIVPVLASAPVRLGRASQTHGVAQRIVTAARPRAPPFTLA
jgi:hypothetical protein